MSGGARRRKWVTTAIAVPAKMMLKPDSHKMRYLAVSNIGRISLRFGPGADFSFQSIEQEIKTESECGHA
jgi:hypothetical protein